MKNLDIEKQLEIIKRGTVEIVSEGELRKKLQESIKNKRPLNIKAGFDPTAPDIHLGHTVLLRKMRQFQELGHEVIFLIGDFTGRIGDPSGRSEIRKQLTPEEVRENAITYKKQVSKILDISKLQIVFNSSWLKKVSLAELLNLTKCCSVSQMIARDDFRRRYSNGVNISMSEFIYPLLQGYDSYKLKADIELGGTDQIFNLLIGREIQQDFGQEPQVIITMPLLEGTDGVQKMSKSYANFIGINEAAKEMFGKIMSISDELMLKYYTLLTDEDLEALKNMHPREAKLKLAETIVTQYHSKKEAEEAGSEFSRVFSRKEVPEDLPTYKLSAAKTILAILLESGLVSSKNEGRRLIQQGGVSLDRVVIEKENALIEKAGILKVGKRRFLRLIRDGSELKAKLSPKKGQF